ncbi:MAG: DUF3179 domain-containing protein [Actinomycetota bacterium]
MVPPRVRLAAMAALAGLTLAACSRAGPQPADEPRDPDPLVTARELVDVLPADSIPSIDDPAFEPPEEASAWLAGREPVVSLELEGEARAYPVQVMTWHEIVNDEVGGRPVAVTYCPLCNSAVAFDRRVDGRVLEFGTSGKLHQSALVMYDRQTDSLWTHFDGLAVQGPLADTRLELIPVQMLSFDQWRDAHGGGRVLSRNTGEARPYGQNPYQGYDGQEGPNAAFVSGRVDPRLPAMARVVGVRGAGDPVAYPYADLARGPRVGVVNDAIGGEPVVVMWRAGVASALDDEEIAAGREVGTSGVFVARAEGHRLTFAVQDHQLVDRRTGSTWSIAGRALSGPLQGASLEPVEHVDTFWFAWAAYHPDTRVFGR